MSSSLILIDSKDRRNPNDTSSQFQVFFSDVLGDSEKIISIENLIIPRSYYNITSFNNTFLIGADTVILDLGNYTNAEFITEMTTKLNSLSIGTFSCLIGSTTGRLSILINAGTFSITSNEKNYNYLGMPRSTTVASVGLVWTSPGVIDLGGSPYIDILINTPMNSTNTTNSNSNILARIPANVTSFQTIFYDTSTFNFVSLLTTKFSSLYISLVDSNQDLVNLNGLDWSLTLNVKSITTKSLN